MFNIILSPIAAPSDDAPPTVNGETIAYRGVEYDLSPLPEGGEIHIGEPFEGAAFRQNGVIHVKLAYHYNWNTGEDHQPLDWSAYTFQVSEGRCPCPIIRRPSGVFEA
jgi:hypothetical protein